SSPPPPRSHARRRPRWRKLSPEPASPPRGAASAPTSLPASAACCSAGRCRCCEAGWPSATAHARTDPTTYWTRALARRLKPPKAAHHHSAVRGDAHMPTKEAIAAFIAESPGKVGKREIARAFGIGGGERIWLKRML